MTRDVNPVASPNPSHRRLAYNVHSLSEWQPHARTLHVDATLLNRISTRHASAHNTEEDILESAFECRDTCPRFTVLATSAFDRGCVVCRACALLHQHITR